MGGRWAHRRPHLARSLAISGRRFICISFIYYIALFLFIFYFSLGGMGWGEQRKGGRVLGGGSGL